MAKRKLQHYLVLFEAETDDPQIQSILDYFCGLKPDDVAYLDSPEFQKEYIKYCDTPVNSIFPSEIHAVKESKRDDPLALKELDKKIQKTIERLSSM